MIVRNAKVFREDGGFESRDLFIEGEHFVADSAGDVLDATGLYALPGLVDIHLHGCVGYDFCDGTAEAIHAIAAYQLANGITSICPATMTYPEDKLAHVARAAADYTSDTGAALVGINMEGPFLSQAKKGAQNPAYIQPPNIQMFRRLQQEARGLFKLVDIAPEEPQAMEFIDALASEVTISLAHTTADYDTARTAFLHGARHVTHLFNAMPALSHRAPGVIGAAFDTPECHVELIADGVHIHPSVVRLVFQTFGDHRVILISDSMMATGLPDGEYSLGGQAVTVHGNLATLHDGTIAGSATNLMNCVRTAVQKMDIPLGSAIKAATINPARAIGIEKERGSLAAGKYADLLLVDSSLRIVHLFRQGKPVLPPS